MNSGNRKSGSSRKLYWWQREPILDGPGLQEPMAFRLRRGGCPEDIEEQYARFFTEEKAAEIAAAGYTFVETAFFKGMGLEYERPEWERSKRFLACLKKHGVRTGVYTQWGTFFTETFFQEVPEARKWVQIGVDGRPIEYFDPPNQYFRWRGCPGNPDFLAFLRKAIDIAVREIGVDVVYFDNLCLFEGHDTLCYCEACRQGFREYLAQKFPTPEALFKRMGLRNVKDVEPPRFRPWTDHTLVAVPIADPLKQEFIEFRCQQLARAWHQTWQYIHSLNSNVAIMGNPSFPRKYNERLTSAIDFWLLKETPALHYMENAVRNVGIRNGVVVSNIRGYKYARVLGQLFVACGGEDAPGLSYCECLAFQHGSGGSLSPAATPYLTFYREHEHDFFTDLEELHEVAVLRHDRSLTWRWHESFTVMELAQHMLMSAGIPWMPLWGQQLMDGTLEKYRVLVVPGCGCLGRDETSCIIEFVRKGGGVVILENAGCYDEY
ncbi:MAG: beta-galactosidase, partial [Kiritimatiellae bacterium]|nr:beta-galactosidase [Kiritimatiellia bacterium]